MPGTLVDGACGTFHMRSLRNSPLLLVWPSHLAGPGAFGIRQPYRGLVNSGVCAVPAARAGSRTAPVAASRELLPIGGLREAGTEGWEYVWRGAREPERGDTLEK